MKPIGITKLRKLLIALDPVLTVYAGEVLQDVRLAGLFNAVMNEILPNSTEEQRWAAWQVFQGMQDKKLSKQQLQSAVCRVAGGLHYIKEGLPAPLWNGHPAFATMQCLGVEHDTESIKKRRLILYLLCLLGEPAGLFFQVSLSCNMLEFIMGKRLGLSFRKYNCPAEEISGCIFTCIVEEDAHKVLLSEYGAGQTVKNLNRALAEARLEPRKCKTPSVPCAVCKKTRKECPLAVWKGK